jgi:hypothetical protein
MDSYNNNTTETKPPVELRERKQNYMRQYEREVEPCTKLSEKVMIPTKKYPKVLFIIRSIGKKPNILRPVSVLFTNATLEMNMIHGTNHVNSAIFSVQFCWQTFGTKRTHI